VVLTDLAEFTHFVTRIKVVPAVGEDPALIEVERTRGRVLAERLSMRVLSRSWQMLLKGITEVENAGRPLAAAEMVLVRIAYAADLPTPDEVIRALDGKQADGRAQADTAAPAAPSASAQPIASPDAGSPERRISAAVPAAGEAAARPIPPALATGAEQKSAPVIIGGFEDLIALATAHRDLAIKLALERDVRLVRCDDGRLEIRLEKTAAGTLVNELTRKLSQWTNRPWNVIVSAEEGQPTVKSQQDARKAELKTGVRADPLVQAVLTRFPGAEIVDVRKAEAVVSQQTDAAQAEESRGGSSDEFDVSALAAEMAIEEHDDA
jgi:DNA polymerase-3 subunit gamma/tau